MKSERKCCICGQPMRRVATMEAGKVVEVDACLGHGVWLDDGELEQYMGAAYSRGHRAGRQSILDEYKKGK